MVLKIPALAPGYSKERRSGCRRGLQDHGSEEVQTMPCPSLPWSFRKYQGKPQKHQGFFSPCEPLKTLENKQKTPQKTKDFRKKKNTKETQTPRKRRTRWFQTMVLRGWGPCRYRRSCLLWSSENNSHLRSSKSVAITQALPSATKALPTLVTLAAPQLPQNPGDLKVTQKWLKRDFPGLPSKWLKSDFLPRKSHFWVALRETFSVTSSVSRWAPLTLWLICCAFFCH